MIRSLRVRNLAVIDELELELGPGLTVVTGETGAGKSVLLGAVAMLCGRRVSAEAIRSGADSAAVEAILETPSVLERARSAGLCDDTSDELLVARTLSASGRGRVLVDGRLCSLGLLAQVVGEAIEVVGQGEHQRLLRPEVQAELLDRFGSLGEERERVRALYARWGELAREIAERRSDAAGRARREDQLRAEIEQIERIDPGATELAALASERARLRHADRLAQLCGEGLEAVCGGAGADAGARDAIARAQVRLAKAAELDPALAPLVETLGRAALELGEAAGELDRYAADLEHDPARLEALERRHAELAHLQERYGANVEEILAHRDRARAELERIGGGEERIAETEAELEVLGRELAEAASALAKRRADAAGDLREAVVRELRALDLRGARFEVRFDPVPRVDVGGREPPSGPRGHELASFLLAANPGEEGRRLRDAASGGELARLLLALQNVLRDDDPRVLLFDEVDAGVGGRTARRIGERLRRLAGRHQILCITHLPQIAALGQAHYAIRKRVQRGRTTTHVELLTGDARVEEIARMSGSGRITEATRRHARELLS